MTKSRRNKKTSIFKKIKNASSKSIPYVDKGLKTVGTTAKNVAVKSIPIVEKGVSGVYGALATGFDLGIKGAKTITKGVTKIARKSIKSKRVKKTHRR